MFEKLRHELLTEQQLELLNENTRIAIDSGMMSSYQATMRQLYQEFRTGVAAGVPMYDAALVRKFQAAGLPLHDFRDMSRAIGAEAPYAFGLESRSALMQNDCASVSMLKVDTLTGSEVPDSRLSIGIVAADGSLYPTEHDFTAQDLAIAIDRVRLQYRHGLQYVMFDQEPDVRWLLEG